MQKPQQFFTSSNTYFFSDKHHNLFSVPITRITKIFLLLGLLFLTLAFPNFATGQTVVAEDRLNLPDGPGSLEGIGENVEHNANMGVMTWEVPLQLPQGFKAMTPELHLRYSSGDSSSIVGMGWSLDIPVISRATVRGVPLYNRDDLFFANESIELVNINNSEPPIYRARFEKDFVRYTWIDAGIGNAGYWRAEYPDGRIATFGATYDGQIIATARSVGDEGVYRYHLVDMVDVFGHRIRYNYIPDGSVSLIDSIGYVFTDGSNPRYQINFLYEDRRDLLSDCRPGFNEVLSKRLKSIDIYSNSQGTPPGDKIRSYSLIYEDYASSGGFTRLSRVEHYGLQNGRYPIEFNFTYSRALGGQCHTKDCEAPYLVNMGSLGLDMSLGHAAIIDLNGDALPDVLNTTLDGEHFIYLNQLSSDGSQSFATAYESTLAGVGASMLGTQQVQLLDANGDGFSDLIDSYNAKVLSGNGSGDWVSMYDIDTSGFPTLQGNDNVRFFDWDNDKRIDIIETTQSGTNYYINLGDGSYTTADGIYTTQNIGATFVDDKLHLEDMNGDGMLDVVKVGDGFVSYRLNFGYGRFSDWRNMTGIPSNLKDLKKFISFVDINGDGLNDILIIQADTVKYALNFNGDAFAPLVTMTSAGGVALPDRNEKTVLFADMNGNGSEDIVWIDHDGTTIYLELFPVKPNLISRISNNIGMITEVTYSSSVLSLARDGGAGAWAYKLPHPMIVVDKIDTWDTLTNVHDVTTYTYHDGYYDGIEKKFRGYHKVEAYEEGDASIESGVVKSVFDVGANNAYRNGLLLKREVFSNDKAIQIQELTYDDCSVAEVPTSGLRVPVRWICEKELTTTIQEGTEATQWVTTQVVYDYDGYGNRNVEQKLGVTAIGGSGCPACTRDADIFGSPCGPQCEGDELITVTSFVPPNATSGRWLLNAPYRVRTFGVTGSDYYTEELTYYDDPPFIGQELATLTTGNITRKTVRVLGGANNKLINKERYRCDEHGNIIESLDPLGIEDGDEHRRKYAYDADGLHLTRVDIFLIDQQSQAYTLAREVKYEPIFGKPVEATRWMRIIEDTPQNNRDSTFYNYDEFARLTAIAKPGDTLLEPTDSIVYDLKAPISRITINRRTRAGPQEPELSISRCIDGRGRQVQELLRLSDNSYQVNGFTIHNVRSKPQRVYQPYLASDSACDSQEPSDVNYTDYVYDATYREREIIYPDADLYETSSRTRHEYLPLAVATYDANDNDSTSAHYHTPITQHKNGLDRLVAIERQLTPEDLPAFYSLTYDSIGHLHDVIDPVGNTHTQVSDLIGRIVKIIDPNSGITNLFYDDAGNEILHTDARGINVQSEYDGANRPIASFDTAAPEHSRISWQYDYVADCATNSCTNAEGLIAQVTYPLNDKVGIDHTGYDIRGQIIARERQIDGAKFTTQYNFDNAGRLIETKHPDGQRYIRSYDGASRLISVADYVSQIVYNKQGLVQSIAYNNGVNTNKTYDSLLRLNHLETSGTSAQLQGFAYQHDRVGNIVSIDDLLHSDANENATSLNASASYTYDAWYRLVASEIAASNNDDGVETLNYTYNNIDNLLSRISSLGTASPEHIGNYKYSSSHPNAAVSAGARSYTYDAAGYLTKRGDISLAWDFLGRLTKANNDDVTVAKFTYGADVDRIKKQEGTNVTYYINDDFEIRDGISVSTVRLGRERLVRQESDALATQLLSDVAPAEASSNNTQASQPDGQINAGDAWLAAAHESGVLQLDYSPSAAKQLLAASARRLLLEVESGTAYLSHDHLGSVTLVTDTQGKSLGRRGYTPFGVELANSDLAIDTYGFTGQERDSSTGLDYYKYRYLDTELGRWVSPDPAFTQLKPESTEKLGEATTAYAYVGNNPINHFDPNGLENTDVQLRKSIKEKTHRPYPRRLTADELQVAADFLHQRFGNKRARELSTTTITQGNKNGETIFTISTSTGLVPGKIKRSARRLLGPNVEFVSGKAGKQPDNQHHSEQRGIAATDDQINRMQASSSNASHGGAACPSCANAQNKAWVRNVTGTQKGGGRIRLK
ncbi:MAG: VCBS repeat-containing protein [Deltaproteobacteria bacterium]|nr:VCBS repeat-containing protein [Deltaproteobacteria bacterium]